MSYYRNVIILRVLSWHTPTTGYNLCEGDALCALDGYLYIPDRVA